MDTDERRYDGTFSHLCLSVFICGYLHVEQQSEPDKREVAFSGIAVNERVQATRVTLGCP